jgi:electron transport complex protein RnfC
MRATKAQRVIVAVSQKDKHIADLLEEQLKKKLDDVRTVLVSNRYPQRNGRELELSLRSFEAGHSLALGALFMSAPVTLAAVFDAVKYHKPVLDRFVAVGGSAVREPKVVCARLGSRIRDVFDECGGLTEDTAQVAFGSPILGRAAYSLDEPITKTTYAVYASAKSNDFPGAGYRAKITPTSGTANFMSGHTCNCIGCGECREICPLGLDPETLYKQILGSEAAGAAGDAAFLEQAQLCHGCGCCEVICPSRLPLGTAIIHYSNQKIEGFNAE